MEDRHVHTGNWYLRDRVRKLVLVKSFCPTHVTGGCSSLEQILGPLELMVLITIHQLIFARSAKTSKRKARTRLLLETDFESRIQHAFLCRF